MKIIKLDVNYSIAVLVIASLLSACSGTRPAYLGPVNQTLQPCPTTPNCVSSVSTEDEDHYIAPITVIHGKPKQALLDALESNPSAEVIVDSPNYIYAEFTTKLMRFVDDVEFLIHEDKQKIDVRSASRIGRSDFGVNRERIEDIRQQLTAHTEQ